MSCKRIVSGTIDWGQMSVDDLRNHCTTEGLKEIPTTILDLVSKPTLTAAEYAIVDTFWDKICKDVEKAKEEQRTLMVRYAGVDAQNRLKVRSGGLLSYVGFVESPRGPRPTFLRMQTNFVDFNNGGGRTLFSVQLDRCAALFMGVKSMPRITQLQPPSTVETRRVRTRRT